MLCKQQNSRYITRKWSIFPLCFADGKIFLRCKQLDWPGQRFGGKSLPLVCKETVVKAFQNVEPKRGGTIQWKYISFGKLFYFVSVDAIRDMHFLGLCLHWGPAWRHSWSGSHYMDWTGSKSDSKTSSFLSALLSSALLSHFCLPVDVQDYTHTPCHHALDIPTLLEILFKVHSWFLDWSCSVSYLCRFFFLTYLRVFFPLKWQVYIESLGKVRFYLSFSKWRR